MTQPDQITIAQRFHGPRNSGNGGYVCGRLASFIDGTARVRLYIPPPLDVPLDVRRQSGSVTLEYESTKIAEAWPAELALDVPAPPSFNQARAASRRFRGFQSHRFASCFVCGRDRAPDDGLQIFAGPLDGQDTLACTWTPRPDLALSDGTVSPEFVWCVLDCPGGFAFPEPENGTILLGELTVARYHPVLAGNRYIVVGWEIAREGRKHHTGTALFSEDGSTIGAGEGIWFEVPEGVVE